MKRICIVVSSPFTLEVFLVPQIRALSKLYKVTVIVNTWDKRLLDNLGVDAEMISVQIERKIRPLRDAHALLKLIRIFRAEDYDLWLRGCRRWQYHNLQEPLCIYSRRSGTRWRHALCAALVIFRAARRDGQLLKDSWYALRPIVSAAITNVKNVSRRQG